MDARLTAFLEAFKVKLGIWGIVYRDDRGKNAQTLLDLDISTKERRKILENLLVEDFIEGPLTDKLNNGADMWVFGKNIKGKEVYIKITLGSANSTVICISFHIAERPLNFPKK
ncbi:MAG: hypothetical protein J0M30_02510 [Chitinophagales bacterium]|nr:hypothetical protein [Chitinophagales bacterium]